MGKVTVITGGTSGIGRGIAEKILKESAAQDRIFVTYGHDEKKAFDFQESLPEEKRSQVILMKADMSSYDEMMTFVGELKKYKDYSFEEWTKIVNTNLSVPVFMVKELRPMIVEGGSVLFTGSYAGQQAYSSSLVYGVTKAAIHFLTKSLVKEFEPKGITVNAIAPGFIETPWHSARTQESYDRINRKIALHRFGTVEEVADMAFAVLSNGYMNGSIVDIHGGYDYF